MNDNINHPKHYEDAGYLVQPIDVCQELPFCLGNAVKYLCRAGNKEGCPELEDLKKAQWYLNRQLALLDNGSMAAVLSARGACAKYRLFIEGGSWCDVNGGAWPEAYSQSVARFRPWGDPEDEE